MKEGRALYGDNRDNWEFRCPCCLFVASIADYKAAGAPNGAFGYSCIGRYRGAKREAFGTGPGPCDYAGGGLIQRNPVRVNTGEETIQMFEWGNHAIR